MTRTTLAAPRLGRLLHITRTGRLFAASALIGAAACGGDSGTAPSKAVAGVYSLEKVARVSVPVQVYEGPFYHVEDQRSYEDFVVIMTSGLLQLTQEGSYQTTLNYTAYKDGVEEVGSLRAWGTYTVANDEIFLKRDNGIDFGTGKLEGGAVVLSLDVIGKGVLKPYTFER
jgi:hypothetical protein